MHGTNVRSTNVKSTSLTNTNLTNTNVTNTNVSQARLRLGKTGLVRRTGMVCMLLAACTAASPAAAQEAPTVAAAPRTTAGFELDALPYISGGYYMSGWHF
jgi:hypothetical protein